MIRFLASELRPVIEQARALHCDLLLVKDHGVYFMSDKHEPSDSEPLRPVAYAVECHPEKLPFDQWYDRAIQEFGGDDFGENFANNNPLFDLVLKQNCDLEIRTVSEDLHIAAVQTDTEDASRDLG